MVPVTKYFRVAFILALCATDMAGCTYRQAGIDEGEAATIKGYPYNLRAVYIPPFLVPSYANIIVGDDEKSLREHLRENKYKYGGMNVRVAPGYRCISVAIDTSDTSCPICFKVKASETYQIRAHRVNHWYGADEIDYVDVMEESSERIVAEQHEFCEVITFSSSDCSKCPLQQLPNNDAAD